MSLFKVSCVAKSTSGEQKKHLINSYDIRLKQMVIEIKLNDKPKILTKCPKPQILVLLIKDPKTFSPKHFTSNNPLERHYNPYINFKYSMGNQCTCNL